MQYCIAKEPPIPTHATIRIMRTEDIPAGLHLCRLSGWNQLTEDWRAFLDSPQGGARVAECAGSIVGTVAFVRYGPWSWLSMMLVEPEMRRSGIGALLMESALDALAGEPCVRLDATPLGEPLYRRFGFRGEFDLARWKIALPTGRPVPLAERTRPMRTADLAAVFARDRQVSGADRSALLASFYRRAPEMAWIASRGNALRGYCFGRPGYLYPQLGPVVAEDTANARELVEASAGAQTGKMLAMDVPRLEPDWIAWLESAGFQRERCFLRMYRGEAPCAGKAAQQLAIAGPEFG